MTPIPNEPSLVFVAIQAALKAGDILRQGFGTTFKISSKGNAQDLVTEYDQLSEKTIINYIKEHFPDHAFLAEESGASSSEEGSVLWIIDPLDGTMNFAHNIPIFSISIAAFINTHVEIGVIYQPMTNELFVARKGCGAYLNSSKLRVSTVTDLTTAVSATGFPSSSRANRQQSIKQFLEILNMGNPIRILGSAALNLAYVAAGRFDAYWQANLQPWDVAAGLLLVEEGGGKVTHYDGATHTIFKDPSTIATNAYLHTAIIEQLRIPKL
jgi:myo-inositol-1(or 4)-monophosphatase